MRTIEELKIRAQNIGLYFEEQSNGCFEINRIEEEEMLPIALRQNIQQLDDYLSGYRAAFYYFTDATAALQ